MASVITNYNIKQITDTDLKDKTPIYYTIEVFERSTTPDETGKYPINRVTKTISYKTAIDNTEIIKLGYCCENKGLMYPIFLEINGSYKEFQIGKTGMFEMSPEEWINVNDINSEEKTSNVVITGVRVPADIDFTLEYVISIN